MRMLDGVLILLLAPACAGERDDSYPYTNQQLTDCCAAVPDAYQPSLDQEVKGAVDAAVVDDGAVADSSDCVPGETQTCYEGTAKTAGVGACMEGSRTCGDDGTWGPCTGQVLPGAEICNNNIDEDCDGADKQCCFEKDFGKLTFDCNCNSKKLTCPAGFHRTGQRYTGTGHACYWSEHDTWAELQCCMNNCSGTSDADHTYITCCPG